MISGTYPAENLLNHTPTFNWDYFDPGDDNPQSKFEIAVGTDPDWTYSEMWNPAPFGRADTFITYLG